MDRSDCHTKKGSTRRLPILELSLSSVQIEILSTCNKTLGNSICFSNCSTRVATNIQKRGHSRHPQAHPARYPGIVVDESSIRSAPPKVGIAIEFYHHQVQIPVSNYSYCLLSFVPLSGELSYTATYAHCRIFQKACAISLHVSAGLTEKFLLASCT